MNLVLLLALPFAAGIAAALAGRRAPAFARGACILALLADLAILLATWAGGGGAPSAAGGWIAEVDRPWIDPFGIRFHLAMDGLSFLLALLTILLGILSVGCSWREIRENTGFFHFNLMWILTGILGVFLAVDLFLFYFAWELMLVPMYFLIAMWGHGNRVYAALKFFLFTQAAGLLLLAAILGLYFLHHRATGAYTFDYRQLMDTPMSPRTEMLLMLGFFVGFAVKLPIVPFHTWLPDAHTEAPTAGSVILAGLMLKTGGYALIRFTIPLFPAASAAFAPVAMGLGVAGILYGAFLAFAQTDLKRMVAYTSVSHLGFVLLGIYAWNEAAMQGAVLEMVCHGLSTGALFILAGQIQERLHTRDVERLGGLWSAVPRMGGVGLFFALASLGLPGLGNFVAEFLVLAGSWRASRAAAAAAAAGLVLSAVYSLWLVQRVFHGENRWKWTPPDLLPREAVILGILAVLLVLLGCFPQAALDAAEPALSTLRQSADGVSVRWKGEGG